jgi:hypothetical protein
MTVCVADIGTTGEGYAMPEWLTYAMTAVGSFAAGILPFFLKWKKQTTDEWRSITEAQATRISVLEARDVQRQEEHIACLSKQSALEGKVSVLDSHNKLLHTELLRMKGVDAGLQKQVTDNKNAAGS